MSKEQKPINVSDLPQHDAFKKREVFQHPQPQDTGKPLNGRNREDDSDSAKREEEKTAKAEGLNEENSAGSAGAFEGFEDQGAAS